MNHTICFSYIPSASYFCFVYWLSTPVCTSLKYGYIVVYSTFVHSLGFAALSSLRLCKLLVFGTELVMEEKKKKKKLVEILPVLCLQENGH